MKNKRIGTILTLAALVLVTALTLSAITNPAAAYSVNVNSDARVRVVHASPDAPAVDVLVNGTPAFTNIEFTNVSDYASLPAGTYHVQVVPAGKTTPVVIDTMLTLSPRTDYTVMAIGKLASIHPLVLVDDNSPVPVGMVRVRFVHASPDAPNVDIAVHNGPVLFSNITFGQNGGYITVPRGTYPLEVRLAGTNTVVLSLGDFTLRGGSTYSVFAMGLVADHSLTAVLHLDSTHHYRGMEHYTSNRRDDERFSRLRMHKWSDDWTFAGHSVRSVIRDQTNVLSEN